MKSFLLAFITLSAMAANAHAQLRTAVACTDGTNLYTFLDQNNGTVKVSLSQLQYPNLGSMERIAKGSLSYNGVGYLVFNGTNDGSIRLGCNIGYNVYNQLVVQCTVAGRLQPVANCMVDHF